MKHIIYIILISAVFYSCAAQKNGSAKVHAYRQAVIQGVRPDRVTDSNGKEVDQVIRAQANFFIYIESPDSTLQVKNVWIKQVRYSASAIPVNTTPIVMRSTLFPGGPSDTLVSATSNKVFQVQLGESADTGSVSTAARQKIAGNELVVHCTIKGRDYYHAVQSIKNLQPVALQ